MIPNQSPIWAEFTNNDNKYRPHKFLVVAWDEDGDPMVIGDKRLKLASDYPNYIGLTEEPPEEDNKIVTAVPGGGYSARYVLKNGEQTTLPVIYWTIERDGMSQPWVLRYGGGEPPEVADSIAGFEEMLAPDGFPLSVPTYVLADKPDATLQP